MAAASVDVIAAAAWLELVRGREQKKSGTLVEVRQKLVSRECCRCCCCCHPFLLLSCLFTFSCVRNVCVIVMSGELE